MGTCCKCRVESHGWGDMEPIVYVNPATKQEYCIFHAPKEEKRKSLDSNELLTLEEFNAKVHARIYGVIKHNSECRSEKGHRTCELSDTIFPGDISFREFDKDNPLPHISFLRVTFCNVVNFWGTTFSSGAIFTSAKFVNTAFFCDAKFYGKASFAHATFEHIEKLRGVHFNETQFNGGASFYKTIFRGIAQFCQSTFKNTPIEFHSTEFHDATTFNEATIDTMVLFKQTTLGEKTEFCGLRVSAAGSVHIEEMDGRSLKHLYFKQADLPIFTFKCWRKPERLGLDVHGDAKQNNLLECEELYRAMKQRAAEEHDQPQASHWHYREKLMAMKRRGNSAFEQAMLWLYFSCSGFGERPGQSLLVLLALIVLSFVANSIKEPWIWAELPGSAAAQYTLATIPFAKDIPGDGWVKAGRGFWQFLIAVQFTLFALAVRNRFRR